MHREFIPPKDKNPHEPRPLSRDDFVRTFYYYNLPVFITKPTTEDENMRHTGWAMVYFGFEYPGEIEINFMETGFVEKHSLLSYGDTYKAWTNDPLPF